MNDKEKLFELAKHIVIPYFANQIAAHFVTNGVTVQKHGRWEPVEDEETSCDEWDCTVCGQRRTFLCEMDADDMKEYYPYCPNCGAKMEVV